MLYLILSYLNFIIIGAVLKHLGLSTQNWEFWIVLLLSVAVSLLGYGEGLNIGMEMMMDAGV